MFKKRADFMRPGCWNCCGKRVVVGILAAIHNIGSTEASTPATGQGQVKGHLLVVPL